MIALRLISCGILATLGLSACGGGSSSEPAPRRVPDLPTYDKSSCRFQPYEGQAALFENLSATQITAERVFNKKFDQADLAAVLTASATETSFYVQDMGVRVFKVPRAAGCPTYYSLPEASPELLSLWQKFSGGGGGEGQLAGLYFENTPTPSDRQVQNPTILVLESSDRWTLVHEMMHHNFNVHRKADTSSPSIEEASRELQGRAREVDTLLKSYEDRPNKTDLKDLALAADRITTLVEYLVVNSIWEEIALENLLLDETAAGRMGYVSEESAQSAAWYIGYARKEGLRQFEPLGELFREVTLEAKKNFWDEIADIIQKAQKRIDELEQRTAQIESSARQRAGLGPNPQPHEIPAFLLLNPRGTDGHLQNLEGTKALDRFRSTISALARARN